MSLQAWLDDHIINKLCPSNIKVNCINAHAVRFAKHIRKVRDRITVTDLNYEGMNVSDLYTKEMPWSLIKSATTKEMYSAFIVIYKEEVQPLELAYPATFPKVSTQEKQAGSSYKAPTVSTPEMRGRPTYKESKASSTPKKRAGPSYKAFKASPTPNKHAHSFHKAPTISTTEKGDSPPYKASEASSTLEKLTNSLSQASTLPLVNKGFLFASSPVQTIGSSSLGPSPVKTIKTLSIPSTPRKLFDYSPIPSTRQSMVDCQPEDVGDAAWFEDPSSPQASITPHAPTPPFTPALSVSQSNTLDKQDETSTKRVRTYSLFYTLLVATNITQGNVTPTPMIPASVSDTESDIDNTEYPTLERMVQTWPQKDLNHSPPTPPSRRQDRMTTRRSSRPNSGITTRNNTLDLQSQNAPHNMVTRKRKASQALIDPAALHSDGRVTRSKANAIPKRF